MARVAMTTDKDRPNPGFELQLTATPTDATENKASCWVIVY